MEEWYKYDLVDQSSLEVVCRACLDVLVKPHVLDCCRSRFCYSCVEQLIEEGFSCPSCGRTKFNVDYDETFQHSFLEDVRAFCQNRKAGCEWQGRLDEVEEHLRSCRHAEVPCPLKCGGRIQRRCLAEHKRDSCPKRPFVCEYCQFAGVHDEVVSRHWPVCENYPLPCPNSCSVGTVPRSQFAHHLSSACSRRSVECTFRYVSFYDPLIT